MTYRFRDLANKQHGPSRATAPEAPIACPDCGSPLMVDEDAQKGTGPVDRPLMTPVRAAICPTCEFIHEF